VIADFLWSVAKESQVGRPAALQCLYPEAPEGLRRGVKPRPTPTRDPTSARVGRGFIPRRNALSRLTRGPNPASPIYSERIRRVWLIQRTGSRTARPWACAGGSMPSSAATVGATSTAFTRPR